MFRNNLISVLRSLWKSKGITLINLIGLTVGLTIAIILLMLIKYETGYDSFHKNGKNICRIITGIKNNERKVEHIFYTPPAMGEILKTEYAELTDRVTIAKDGPKLKIKNELYTDITYYADNNIFKIFSFNMIGGSSEKALTEPNTIVLTKSLAKKIFGNTNPLNQVIDSNGKSYEVTGIIEDIPTNSTFRFSALISLSSFSGYSAALNNWNIFGYYVFINIPEALSKEAFEPRLQKLAEKHTEERSFFLQPLFRIHLYSKADYGMESKLDGNVNNLILYTFFAFFILLIVIINYTNISFNQIHKKSSEVGMRRILGASKYQVFIRSWLEAFLSCAVSVILALLIVNASLPELNLLINRKIGFSFIMGSIFDVSILLLAISILLGLIPALRLVKNSTPQVLRKAADFNKSNKFVKGMLVVQFAIALFFLISTILVSRQINFINSNVGVKEEEEIIDVINKYDPADKGAAGISKIFFAAVSQNNIIKTSYYEGGGGFTDLDINNKKVNCLIMNTSDTYFSFVNSKIKIGRDFNEKTYPSDAAGAVVVNESFINKYNIADPLNTQIFSGERTYKIIGVAEDFYFSLKDKILPVVIMPAEYADFCSFKIDKKDTKAALDIIRKEWAKYYPDRMPKIQFESENVGLLYFAELTAQKIFSILSLISIFLSLLGVIGLSSLIMVKRKKEIAIRKIHGATINSLLFRFSKEFMIVIAIAFTAASALSYSYINKFLEDFVYKIKIDSIPFIESLATVMAIVLLTVTIQSLKALYANPIESIKSE